MVLADEDPGQDNRYSILSDVRGGVVDKKMGIDLFVMPERMEAISFLVKQAASGDIVFLAGK